MHASDLRTLIHYNYWARDRMLDAVAKLPADQYAKPLGNSFSSVRDTVVHIYGAEWVWFSRFKGENPGALPKPEGFADLPSLVKTWGDIEAGWRSLVANLGDDELDVVITFKTLAGASAHSPLSQIIQHVVNHGSYHRGQVTTMLRQLGAEPPKSMDLIFYYREQAK
jgi:uncharacterized damage-inducible protein DinB